MTISVGYIVASIALAAIITLALRALPFALLKPLRSSRFIKKIGQWMPAGLIVLLAIIMLWTEAAAHLEQLWVVILASVVTVVVHLVGGRRAVLSIFVGTATYIALLAIVP